jgi:hypothetical protein
MIVGLIVINGVWLRAPIAFTWYVLIGAVSTCLAALIFTTLSPKTA